MTTTENATAENATTENATTTNRSPLIATALSLFLPGLGNLYCGQVVSALAWAALSAACGVIAIALLTTQHLFSAWIPALIVMTCSAVHARQIARGTSHHYELKPWNRWYVYLLFFFVCSVGGLGHALVIREQYVEAFYIPTRSMSPTFTPGDRVLVNKGAYRDNEVKIQDVVVFANPEEPTVTFVKRVAALAGDVVEVKDGQLLVNGQQARSSATPETPDFGPITVPRFNCFVLGDNLNQSKDSRHFGPIALATVRGKAVTVYWPRWQTVE